VLALQPPTASPYAPMERHPTDILSRFGGFLAKRTGRNTCRSMHGTIRVRVWIEQGTNESVANGLNVHIPQYSGYRQKQNLD
jgi:hypothetical protein